MVNTLKAAFWCFEKKVDKQDGTFNNNTNPDLFYFWTIQLNNNDELLMQITVYIQSNKHYFS